MKRLIKESGIRDINKIAKRYKRAKIYFHQDLDGVTTAIAMKNYLEQSGIEVVDAEVIQYGDKEFAIKKPEGEGDVMPVLVDFAHGKPMFVIHTDHHDSQAGVEKDTATSFKHSRSNVETISQTLSPKEIFPSEDIMIISTVDSANFAVNKITPAMVMNFLFKFDKDESIRKNKITMGLVTNKLLLAFKNKPRFLEELVLNSKPSLLSILNNIKKIVTEKGYAKPEELATNQQNYIEKQSKSENVKRVGNIIVQYGGGSMTKAGSYDRYTPFKNNPDADFIVIAWPMGLVQASCNPFKEDRSLKGVDLGEMKNEVLQKFESMLKNMNITFGSIKRISESSANYSSVGFTYKDMVAIYGKAPSFKVNGGEKINEILNNISDRLYRTLSDKQKELLEKVTVSGWDVIMANSGGHKCITNISGMMYLFSKRKNNQTIEVEFSPELQPIANYSGSNTFVKDIKSKLLKYGNLSPKQIDIATSVINKEGDNTQKEDYSSYVELTKAIQDEFVRVLNGKIESQENLQESKKEKEKKYYVDKSDLGGKGVFAAKDIKKGETIGLLHKIIKIGSKYEFTELGKMHNHKDKPNCHNERIDNKRYLVASENIKKGQELTTDYRLQPDLEQPQDWLKESVNKKEGIFDLLKKHINKEKTLSETEWKYIIKKLDCVVDNRGQWDHPGKCTMIETNRITMQNVDFPLVGIDDTGHIKLMLPENDYKFPGNKVFEIPLKGKYKNLGLELLKF
jgi:hypothetical protein